ncbi:hypothetical protein SL003B_2025 [Polymorphum gilvum SL003B-26A1]|uniref:Uncharacterized protein n=1 Tax=Polymorphum gilvum (strain LMG 25793 / CGMCC 1.9160 / SL003B-26A1) TaxID=991905 RepID=F2IXD4_POLGS|nr:hypothetical protein SL003B_2025 [Polymorphum gilvum SL003B-26A1]
MGEARLPVPASHRAAPFGSCRAATATAGTPAARSEGNRSKDLNASVAMSVPASCRRTCRTPEERPMSGRHPA